MDGPDAAGRFQTTLTLESGAYEDRFVLEGKSWRNNPGNRRQKGDFNNRVLVLEGAPGVWARADRPWRQARFAGFVLTAVGDVRTWAVPAAAGLRGFS